MTKTVQCPCCGEMAIPGVHTCLDLAKSLESSSKIARSIYQSDANPATVPRLDAQMNDERYCPAHGNYTGYNCLECRRILGRPVCCGNDPDCDWDPNDEDTVAHEVTRD